MGLFDSKTKQTVTQNTTTNTETTQLDQSGNEGVNLAQVGGNVSLDLSSTNISMDPGAIAAGRDLGLSGIQAAQESSAGALAFGRNALSEVAEVNSNSLSMYADLMSGALDTTKTLAREGIEASSNALSLFSNFAKESTQSAVSGFNQLARQSSESGDDRVSKVAMYALAALAASMILPAILKGAR